MLGQQTKKTSHRVNVNFSEGAYASLQRLAERRGKSISEILRDAIAFESWYQETADSGGRILIEREDGSLRELVRP